jgi:hypothetical protein
VEHDRRFQFFLISSKCNPITNNSSGIIKMTGMDSKNDRNQIIPGKQEGLIKRRKRKIP